MSQTKHILMSSEFRSGSALAACILNAHPEVSFSTDVIKYWRFSYDRYLGSNKNSTTHILKEIARRIHLKFSINLNIEECLDQIGNNFNHKYIYTVVADKILNNSIENKVIGENETLSWKYIPYFLENIPDSKAIMIMRDPRDVLVSFKKHTIVKNNNYLVSVFNSLSLMQNWISLKKKYKTRFLGIKYNELKNDHEEYAKLISTFLGINFNQTMIDSKKWTVRSGNSWKKWENEKSSSFRDYSNNPLYKNPIGRWRNIIDPVDHYICEWVTGKYLKKFDFEPEFSQFSEELYHKAFRKLTSTTLLKNCLTKFLYHNVGSEEYPTNPFKPQNWDRRYLENPNEI